MQEILRGREILGATFSYLLPSGDVGCSGIGWNKLVEILSYKSRALLIRIRYISMNNGENQFTYFGRIRRSHDDSSFKMWEKFLVAEVLGSTPS